MATDLPELPDPVIDACAGPPKKFAMVEVRESGASANPCDATTANSSCPTDTAVFYDQINQETTTVPAVDSLLYLTVCGSGNWTPGMWVYIPNLGRFPIVAINDNVLTLRNSCSDGGAIPGNLDPGTSITSLNAKIWPSDEKCDAGGFCEEVVQCISDADDLSFTSTPEQTSDESVMMLGTTAEDPCGDGSIGNLRKMSNIIATYFTLLFKAIPEADVDDCPQLAVFTDGDPCDDGGEGKQLAALPLPANDGVYKVCGGCLKYVEGGQLFIPQEEVCLLDLKGSVNPSGGLSSAMNIPPGILVNNGFSVGSISLPEPAEGCGDVYCYKLRVSFLARHTVSDNAFGFILKIGGQEVAEYWITNAVWTNDQDWSGGAIETDLCFDSAGVKDITLDQLQVGTGGVAQFHSFRVCLKGQYA